MPGRTNALCHRQRSTPAETMAKFKAVLERVAHEKGYTKPFSAQVFSEVVQKTADEMRCSTTYVKGHIPNEERVALSFPPKKEVKKAATR